MSTAMTVENAPSPRGGGIWEYVSPSRLNCWLSCPLKFKIRYVDGIRTPTTPSLFLGKVVHRGLEIFNRHRQLGVRLELADVTSRMLTDWAAMATDDGMTFADADEEKKLQQQAVALVTAYLQQVPEDEPTPLAVEATMQTPLIDPFTGEDLGIPLLGVIDLILPDADGPLVADFKTSARSSPPFEISHEIQLTSYAYLHRELTGVEEGGLEIRSLIKTKQPKIECHRYAAREDRHFRRLFSVIREYLDALDSGRFNYRPGWSCGMCDHRDGACRAWAG